MAIINNKLETRHHVVSHTGEEPLVIPSDGKMFAIVNIVDNDENSYNSVTQTLHLATMFGEKTSPADYFVVDAFNLHTLDPNLTDVNGRVSGVYGDSWLQLSCGEKTTYYPNIVGLYSKWKPIFVAGEPNRVGIAYETPMAFEYDHVASVLASAYLSAADLDFSKYLPYNEAMEKGFVKIETSSETSKIQRAVFRKILSSISEDNAPTTEDVLMWLFENDFEWSYYANYDNNLDRGIVISKEAATLYKTIHS